MNCLGRKQNHYMIRDVAKDLVYDCIGALLQGAALQFFVLPGEIALGGVPGIAQIIRHLTGISIGLLTLLANIPLFAAAWLSLGKAVTLKTIKSVIILSLFIDLAAWFIPMHYEGDRLLAAVFGGAVIGIGQSLIFLRCSTGGGGDIIAKIIQKKSPGMKLGRAVMIVNFSVMAVYALVLKELETVLYGIICMVFMAQALDMVLYGLNKGAAMLIISKKNDEITDRFINVLRRGVTVYHGTGGYSSDACTTLFCVMNNRQIPAAKAVIDSIDPEAFTVVSETKDVFGQGFTSFY
ncbi:YitT family protein [Clostridium sp. MCC353]|uniref:YitT family protein n=1 Tax=Clostridium sp. MCC353 TaxID=2592646 RepID=UPI001C0294C6|nr:YitT family protein [Clostridium sp. MCC353]